MSDVVETFEGWFSLHLIYKIDFQKWQQFDDNSKKVALEELHQYLSVLDQQYEAHEGSYSFYQVTGAKGDLLLWLLQPTVEDLNRLETNFDRLKIGAVLTKTYSFVSVIEASNYMKVDKSHPSFQEKLYPKVPRTKYMCFYPMSKKRNLSDNWYMTDYEERSRMMRSHGKIGRSYQPVLKEYTTAACGMDDWEWGISLFGDDPVQFKKIVYEMRFDEVSARFGLFGPFCLGSLITDDVLVNIFK